MKQVTIKKLGDEIREYLSNYNLQLCLTCGTCVSGCPTVGAPDLEGLDVRKVLRMLAFGMVEEVVNSDFPWVCTGCGRCVYGCPMGVDTVAIMKKMKGLRPRDQVPGVLHKGVEQVLATGNNLGIPKQDYLFLLADVGGELAEQECPGFYVPVDREGAEIGFWPNSKEVFGEPDDMKWWWKIFYAAKENWTVPSENWESVDWGLFTGNDDASRTLAKRKIEWIKKFKIKRAIMPDCGGGSFGFRASMEQLKKKDPSYEINFVYLYEYLVEIIKSGRIKLDPSKNKGMKFTWHDSCKHGRECQRVFGKGYFEEPRWIIKQCVGEENFVDMYPNRMNSYCCGAGGGNWPMPFEKQSAYHGRRKYESIKNSGADVVVVGCSNCRDQLMKRVPKYHTDYKYEVKYIWQLVAETLVIEPWSEEEVKKAEEEAKAQWERFGVSLDEY